MRIMGSRCGDGRGNSGEGNEAIAGQMGVAGSAMTGKLVIRQANSMKNSHYEGEPMT